MDQTLVFNLNQQCINGIRSAGATTQLILVEGNAYTGAYTWVSSGNAASLINLVDPNDNIAYGNASLPSDLLTYISANNPPSLIIILRSIHKKIKTKRSHHYFPFHTT